MVRTPSKGQAGGHASLGRDLLELRDISVSASMRPIMFRSGEED